MNQGRIGFSEDGQQCKHEEGKRSNCINNTTYSRLYNTSYPHTHLDGIMIVLPK